MENTLELNGKVYKLTEVVPEPVKVGRWKPKRNEEYWTLGIGSIWAENCICGPEYTLDQFRFEIGNIYQTKALALAARDKQLLMVELQDFADEANVSESGQNYNYYLVYNQLSKRWEVDYLQSVNYLQSIEIPGIILFTHNTHAKNAIAHFGKRLDLLLV